jgi:hypothetical protein
MTSSARNSLLPFLRQTKKTHLDEPTSPLTQDYCPPALPIKRKLREREPIPDLALPDEPRKLFEVPYPLGAELAAGAERTLVDEEGCVRGELEGAGVEIFGRVLSIVVLLLFMRVCCLGVRLNLGGGAVRGGARKNRRGSRRERLRREGGLVEKCDRERDGGKHW